MSDGRILDRFVPTLTGDGMDWMLDAACAQTDPDIFFPGVGGTNKEVGKICAKCDVAEQCLAYIMKLERGKGASRRIGFFGGMAPRERWAYAQELGEEEETDDEYPESYGG